MKRKVLRIIACIIGLSFLLFVEGCGAKSIHNEPQLSPYDAIYSNLADMESQELLRAALENNGVQHACADALIENIVKYNNAAGSILPVQTGFEVFTKDTASAYNATKLEKKWKKEYHDLTGRRNCRITAFEAMGSLISYDTAYHITKQRMLVETADLSVFHSDSDIDKFSALFNGIESAEDMDASSQAEGIREYWKKCGIGFEETGNVSLISVWFNAPGDYEDNDRYILHCGHAAVMIHTENDGVWLLEKLDYNFPYQLIKFPSEDMALRYIVDFNCGEIEGTDIIPVVFVNDHVLRMQEGLIVY